MPTENARLLVDAINANPHEADPHGRLADELIDAGHPGANIVVQAGRHARDDKTGFHLWSSRSAAPLDGSESGSAAGNIAQHYQTTRYPNNTPEGRFSVSRLRPRFDEHDDPIPPERSLPPVIASVRLDGTNRTRRFHAAADWNNVDALAEDLPPAVADELRRAVADRHGPRPEGHVGQPVRLGREEQIKRVARLNDLGVLPEPPPPGIVIPKDKGKKLPPVLSNIPVEGGPPGFIHPDKVGQWGRLLNKLWGTGPKPREKKSGIVNTDLAGQFKEESVVSQALQRLGSVEMNPTAHRRKVEAYTHLFRQFLKEFPDHPVVKEYVRGELTANAPDQHFVPGSGGASKPEVVPKTQAFRDAANSSAALAAEKAETRKGAGQYATMPLLGPAPSRIVNLILPVVKAINTIRAKAGVDEKFYHRDGSPFTQDGMRKVEADADAREPKPSGGVTVEDSQVKPVEVTPTIRPAPDAAPIPLVDGRKVKTAVRAAEAQDRPPVSAALPDSDPIELAPTGNEKGARWATIHHMLRDGHERPAIMTALKKLHGLTTRQASDTMRRFVGSATARKELAAEPTPHDAPVPGKPFHLARPVEPHLQAHHDSLVRGAAVDKTGLAALGDFLQENGHPNAALVQQAAVREGGRASDGTGYKEPKPESVSHDLWHDPDQGGFHSIRPGDAGEYPTLGTPTYSSHVTGGRAFVTISHTTHNFDHGLSGHVVISHTPIHSREDFLNLTTGLHPKLRSALGKTLWPHLPDRTPKGPDRLARKPGGGYTPDARNPATDETIKARQLVAQNKPDTLWVKPDPAGGPNTLERSEVDPQIAGTSLAYHLNSLYREHQGKDSKIAALAHAALTNQNLPGVNSKKGVFQLLGEALKKNKHRKADLYDWSSKDRTLGEDHWVEGTVKQLVKPSGRAMHNTHEFWEKVRDQLAGGTHKDSKKFMDALWLLAHKSGATRVGVLSGGKAERLTATKGMGADRAAFEEAVKDALVRVADRHQDRVYMQAVARSEKGGVKSRAANPGWEGTGSDRADWEAVHGESSPLHWRKVMGRSPQGVHRLERSHES